MVRRGKSEDGSEGSRRSPAEIRSDAKGKRANRFSAKKRRDRDEDFESPVDELKVIDQHADRSKQRFSQETGLEPPVETTTQSTADKPEEATLDIDDLLDRAAAKSQEAASPSEIRGPILTPAEQAAFRDIWAKDVEDDDDDKDGPPKYVDTRPEPTPEEIESLFEDINNLHEKIVADHAKKDDVKWTDSIPRVTTGPDDKVFGRTDIKATAKPELSAAEIDLLTQKFAEKTDAMPAAANDTDETEKLMNEIEEEERLDQQREEMVKEDIRRRIREPLGALSANPNVYFVSDVREAVERDKNKILDDFEKWFITSGIKPGAGLTPEQYAAISTVVDNLALRVEALANKYLTPPTKTGRRSEEEASIEALLASIDGSAAHKSVDTAPPTPTVKPVDLAAANDALLDYLDGHESKKEPVAKPDTEVTETTVQARPYVAWYRGGDKFDEHLQKTRDRQDITADNLLNNGEFIKWLAEYYEYEEVSEHNIDRLKEIYAEFDFEKQAATKSRDLIRDFKLTYSAEIRQALGVVLTNKDFSDIEGWLARQVKKDPEQILSLAETFKQFKELPNQVKAAEADFDQAVSKTRSQSEKLRNLQTARQAQADFQKTANWFARTFKIGKRAREVYDNLDLAKEALRQDKSLDLAKIDLSSDEGLEKVLEQIEQSKVAINEASRAKAVLQENMQKIREQIFDRIEPATMIFGLAHDRLIQEIQTLTQSSDVTNLDKAQQRLEKMNNPERSGFIDLALYALDNPGSIEGLQRAIDEKIEILLTDGICRAIKDFRFPANGSFDSLQKSLRNLIDREQAGSKVGYEVKFLIAKTLEDILADDKNFAGPDGKAKKVLVKSLLLKI